METGGIKIPFRANFTTACVACTGNFIRSGRCQKGVSTSAKSAFLERSPKILDVLSNSHERPEANQEEESWISFPKASNPGHSLDSS